MFKLKNPMLVFAMLSASSGAYASNVEPEASVANESNKKIEVISIFGQRNKLETTTGSAFVINEELLEQYEFDDIHRVLQSVPGVYIREEDGYGLRPNIGLRGATTERSSKVAIMEDGVLIAPAPYAAPAAYYFPLMSRMSQVEVFKGPSAIKYGPNTVGGAINLVSRQIADVGDGALGELDLAIGENNYQKMHAVYSQSFNNNAGDEFGFMAEALTIKSDGFKALPNDQDTGFNKNEVVIKANYIPKGDVYQWWQMKFAYADEVSHETYLGLTDNDFNQDAYQRYIASKNDKMDWEHYQFQVSHFIELNSETNLFTQVYQRHFDRDWDRLNSFNTNRSLQTILTSPKTGLNALFMEVLTGQRDTLTEQEQLIFTLNERQYYSRGIESKLMWDTALFNADLALDAGLRLHQDQVKRNHRSDLYRMQAMELVHAGEQQITTVKNKDTATAIAGFLNGQLDFGQLTLSAGLRIESIEGEATDLVTQATLKNRDTIILPGLGIFFSFNDDLGLLAGVNKGYVPNSPGQQANIDPEESWNYEFGLRYASNNTRAEVIGFFNDYSNLKGTCTFSSGCETNLDQEYNGGAVEVYGIEASFNHEFSLTENINFPVNIAYTHTQSEFQTAFNSSFSQWGQVRVGDELPYLPKHQLSTEFALSAETWRAAILLKYVSRMSEAAGVNTELTGFDTETLVQADVSVWHYVNDAIKLYLKVDNITDETTVVSRRPFGARPGKPRNMSIGLKYNF